VTSDSPSEKTQTLEFNLEAANVNSNFRLCLGYKFDPNTTYDNSIVYNGGPYHRKSTTNKLIFSIQ